MLKKYDFNAAYNCPFCAKAYRTKEEHSSGDIDITYACGTKLNLVKQGNNYKFKWDGQCAQRLKDSLKSLSPKTKKPS